MTLQQIKEEVTTLSETDRLALQAFLTHLGRVDDPAYRQDLSRRRERLEAGGGVSLDDFIRLNSAEEIEPA